MRSFARSYYGIIGRRLIGVFALSALFLGTSITGALADGTYGEAQQIPYAGDQEYQFASSTYAAIYDDTVYQYATGTDGNGYYAIYDGSSWTGWTGWDEQPVTYAYDPAPCTYQDSTYVYYAGDDGGLYRNSYDGSA